MSAASLPTRVLARALAEPQRTILRKKRLGVWRPTTGAELTRAVADCAAGLAARGVGSGAVAGVLAAPGPEWVVADLAIQSAGAVCAGFHAETAPGELAALVRRCAPRVLFVDGQALRVALDLAAACADLATIVCFDPVAVAEASDPRVVSYDALIEQGAGCAQRRDAPWAALAATAEAAIIPTSGSTGPAKGARLTHAALCAAVDATLSLVDVRDGDERLSLMQASHAFERVFGLYACLAAGAIVNFPESPETIAENLRELQPQIVSGPPAFWTGVLRRLQLATAEASRLQRAIFERAMKSGGALANLIVLDKVRRDLGLARARVALSGGAPLPADARRRFAALGVTVADVYALAEAGPVAIADSAPRNFRLARGVEYDVDADGALRLRAATLYSGYAGEAAFADPWFATGDIGAGRGAEGFDLAAAQDAVVDGDRASLWPYEEAIVASPYIVNCVVSGASRDRLSALLMMDYDAVVRYAQARATPFTHFRSLAQAADVRALLAQEIERVNAMIAPARIVDFAIADRAVGPDDPERGPALNLRRRIVRTTFAATQIG